MAQPVIQASFNSGEWSPHLYARVDIQKYHSGAALLRNFFVDYRGGASTRVGTRYSLQAKDSTQPVRLIPFQAAKTLGFVLEFGAGYIRFYRNGSPVLEAGTTISSAAIGSPTIFTDTAHGYSVGDWIFGSGKYYIVQGVTTNTFTLTDLFGVAVNNNPFTLPISAQRVYTIVSPYAPTDLATLKFTQNVDVMIFCHPAYTPYVLTFAAPTSWTMTQIVFGAGVIAPVINDTLSTLGVGSCNYRYGVTAIDNIGNEGAIATVDLTNLTDIRTNPGTNYVNWAPVSGAVSYNIYRADVCYTNPVPPGSSLGFIGNSTGTLFADSNIAPDFSTTPPIPKNPFSTDSQVGAVRITAGGSYTTATPICSFTAPPSGVTATGSPILSATAAVVAAGGTGYVVNDAINLANGVSLIVKTLSGSAVATVAIAAAGATIALPGGAAPQLSTSGVGTGATFNVTWTIIAVAITNQGTGYIVAPTIAFSGGGAAATPVLGASNYGYPSVVTFFQQRLVFAGTFTYPQTLFMSQPGDYYNFDISAPVQGDDAITASIVSGQLSNIKAMVPQPTGLIIITDGVSYLINGGSPGAAVTPSAIVANQQSYVGSSDLPPIVSNFDILTIPAKGSSCRDSTYNFYANVFTGTDISVLASHLFYGHQMTEWAWAEEPFKLVWVVRDDGVLIALTFIKEQEFIAWSHHDTAGLFLSVATIVESATVGYQNFIYTVVERVVQGQTLKYIEFFPDRLMPNGVADANTVDCSYQYTGAPATHFTGATALAGLTCTGLADGIIIPSFVMPTSGAFTLGTAASKVTVGLAFTAQLQTLPLDTGDPTIQSKMKKIPAETVRVTETLGLQIGTDFNNLTNMKDLIRGNIGSMSNTLVTGLVTGDARTFLDPKWQELGQISIQQGSPYPATILGVIPQLAVGDTPK